MQRFKLQQIVKKNPTRYSSKNHVMKIGVICVDRFLKVKTLLMSLLT